MKPEVSISCDLSLYSHFRFVSLNRLVETCCDRTKIVCCEQICRRSVNKLAADLIKTTRDRSVGTDCNNLLISTDLLQVVISDLLSLVSNRLVAQNTTPQNKDIQKCIFLLKVRKGFFQSAMFLASALKRGSHPPENILKI